MNKYQQWNQYVHIWNQYVRNDVAEGDSWYDILDGDILWDDLPKGFEAMFASGGFLRRRRVRPSRAQDGV